MPQFPTFENGYSNLPYRVGVRIKELLYIKHLESPGI